MRLVIIGNAKKPRLNPIFQGWQSSRMASFIDDSDLVIRFNGARNQEKKWSGTKTSRLYIRAQGEPGKRYAGAAIHFNHVDRPNDVISVFDPNPYKADQNIPEAMIDFTQPIGLVNFFHNIRRLDQAVIERAVALIRQTGCHKAPSSGFFAMVEILNDSGFDRWDKYIAGFDFMGWEGHSWEAERKIVRGWLDTGLIQRIEDRPWFDLS